MHTKALTRVVLDIGHLASILEDLLVDAYPDHDTHNLMEELDLNDYIFKIYQALLTFSISKDTATYKMLLQAVIDKMVYDLNKIQLSYHSVHDIITATESYVLRALTFAVPDIDGEGVIIDSITRLNKTSITINLLKC